MNFSFVHKILVNDQFIFGQAHSVSSSIFHYKKVEAKREHFDYHKKRELEEHLLVKLRSYVLGISNLFKYRLKIWSSGDISTWYRVRGHPQAN